MPVTRAQKLAALQAAARRSSLVEASRIVTGPLLRSGSRSRSTSPRPCSSNASTVDLNRRITSIPYQDDREILSTYTYHARDVVNITLVYCADDLLPHRAQRSFKPKMTNQIFGASEVIFGYKKLVVNIFYSAYSAHCYVDVKYTGVIGNHNGPFPDDVVEQLTPWLPAEFTTDKHYFISTFLQSEKPSNLFGTTLETFSAHNPLENQTYYYLVTKATHHTEGFLDFHCRFESLIVWHIDAASRIRVTDRRWTYFYLYEQRPRTNNEPCGFYPVGYCSVYRYKLSVTTRRARISQFYILPPCQRYGLGSRLLTVVRKQICQMRRIVDMTVETPCPEFTFMRDMQDCLLLIEMDLFKYPAITSGFTPEMLNEAQRRFKIHNHQCRRVYDILRMSYMMSTGDVELYEEFRLDVEEYQKFPFAPEPQGVLKLHGTRSSEPQRRRVLVTESSLNQYLTKIKNMAGKLNERLTR